jgi:hypothetical protein
VKARVVGQHALQCIINGRHVTAGQQLAQLGKRLRVACALQLRQPRLGAAVMQRQWSVPMLQAVGRGGECSDVHNELEVVGRTRRHDRWRKVLGFCELQLRRLHRWH